MPLTKKTLLLFAVFFVFPFHSFSQNFFDFENGNLNGWQQSVAGHWEASPVNPICGNFSLHHSFDNPSSGHDQISIAFPNNFDLNDTIRWSFRIRYGYSPSLQNNWAVFLVSNKDASYMCPGQPVNGIVVGVNYTGSDDTLKLWKIENGVETVVMQSSLNWETSVSDSAALVECEMAPGNSWKLKVSADGSKSDLREFGNAVIPYFPEANYFGIYYKYSSAQDRKLWIDDVLFEGKYFIDTVKPYIDTAIVSNRTIDLHFSEALDSASLTKNCFTIESDTSLPDSVVLIDRNLIRLIYANDFPNGKEFILNVSGIKDLAGNTMVPFSKGLCYFVPSPFDVLITEIMADPDPAIGLPPYEYLELYNQTDFPVSIENWQLLIGGTSINLPDAIVQPQNYIILCNENAKPDFEKFSNTISCWTDEYMLTNTGSSIVLKDDKGHVMSFVNYSDEWYSDVYKQNGGWSLEMIDPQNPCTGKENWAASIDKSGGTPGRQNSVWAKNPDVSTPEYYYTCVPNDSTIILHFSEPLDLKTGLDTSIYILPDELKSNLRINFYNNDFSAVEFNLAEKLSPGKSYKLCIKNKICNCAGNHPGSDTTVTIVLPQQPDSFDVVINEVLFNTYPEGSEFVEFFNRSEKIIDGGAMVLTALDTLTLQIKSFVTVADPGFLLFPGSYLAITGNIAGVEKFYNLKDKKAVLECTGFPALTNEQGIICLSDKALRTIDRFWYNEKMHFALLSSVQGVSLERVRPDLPTQSSSNWHSASQAAGFATPGYENSQFTNETTGQNIITISPEVFTPDNDGRDDFVSIEINQQPSSNTATIYIFNASGMLIRHLVPKEYLGTNNTFTWDGTSDDRKLQPPGIYVIYTLLLSDHGNAKEFKNVCVLSRK